ncbi:MAG: ParB/RepB/Spo0J family partition protein [Candidatus Omnitrophica bacterium]|nr:ParB/RepB/Spo0J family partition protein [Candidatus Omnitrophota bacterium]
MERKALGRGISALIPEKDFEAKNNVINVQTDLIKPNPYQPREDFDMEGLEDLTQSIRAKGVIQPIIVRRVGDDYELIAGERRLRAAKMLGLKEIPIIVREASDEDSLELALIENVQRESLNPIEEARAFKFLIEKFSITQDRIGEILGKSRVSVTNTLRLLTLPQEIQDDIRRKKISFAHGRALLEVENENEQRRLNQEIITKGLSVRELETIIKMHRPKMVKRRAQPGQREPFVAVLEEELQHRLATKVRIAKNKKRGSITIEFYSTEDLTRIVSVIKGGTN